MDIDLPPEDDPRRVEVRSWLADHPNPSGRVLAEAGYVVPHWPRPWGHDADPELQLIIDDELRRAEVRRPINPIGTGHCGPILVVHGSDEQKARYLLPMLSGEEMWCQLFSEPGAGSDLANLSTRAMRDGDVYIVNGQKIWTSLAQVARFGILIARTNSDVAKHRGISYFIVPMDSPGIEIRPIRNMTETGAGGGFNEVFFTDVRVPAENLIGEENHGWAMAKETLANERVSLSQGGVTWGHGPTTRDLVELIRAQGGLSDPLLRQRLMTVFIEGEILRYHHFRQISAAINKKPGPDASLRKALNDPHGQKVFNLAKDILGAKGMLAISELEDQAWAQWSGGFLFSPALTVGGGTSQVLRNVIAERMLGLPHDIDVEIGKTWSEAHSAAPGGRAPAEALSG
ncbi:MAG TPA: acyl-CoA dehydrogenase family protein [Acidimicrobiales bacterium]|nr:acyl-CoA dehydrogenase family protein [Acidimicrobiales bacterium]